MPFGSIGCTYHQLKYSSPNRSKKPKKRATQQSLPFGKWKFGKKEVRRMGQKTERATGLDRRTREEIQKSGIKLTALRFQMGVDIRITNLKGKISTLHSA